MCKCGRKRKWPLTFCRFDAAQSFKNACVQRVAKHANMLLAAQLTRTGKHGIVLEHAHRCIGKFSNITLVLFVQIF